MSKYPRGGQCYACGHIHPVMAQVWRAGETRWFCHENGHSCYAERNHFTVEVAMASVPTSQDMQRLARLYDTPSKDADSR